MRILILCSNYEPGGAQRVSFRIEEALKARNHDVELWFMHRKSDNFLPIEPNIFINQRLTPILYVKLIIRIFRKLKQNKPEVILTLLPYANILGSFIAKIAGVKTRVASHRNECDKELSPTLKKIDATFANNGIYTAITAVSESTKKSFLHYIPDIYNKIQVINNGLFYKPPNISKEEARTKFGLTQKTFIIGAIGRLVEQKNHLFLVKLLPELPHVNLVIVGKGPLKQQILDKANTLKVAKQLTIIDELKTDVVPEFLCSIDVFIMPSLFEGLSNALIEALHAQLPIIVSDVPSQRDVIFRQSDELTAGFILKLDTPKDWIKAIKSLQNSTELRTSLAYKAKERSNDFTIETMTDGYLEVFNS